MSGTVTTNGGGQTTKLPAKSPVATLRDLLDKHKGQIAMALPKHMTAGRMIRVAMTACQQTPGLLECEPVSVVAGVMKAAELGLELSGPLGQAYLTPYGNKNQGRQVAQFQIGYRGYLRLAYNSGLVQTFYAEVVKDGDEFNYFRGTRPGIRHVPAMKGRGQLIAAYAVIQLQGGAVDFELMSKEELDAHRKRYSRAGQSSPWATNFDEMAKKTVIKKLAKRAPLSAECFLAMEKDADVAGGEVVEPAAGGQWQDAPALPVPAAVADGEVIDHTPDGGREIGDEPGE